MTQHIHNQLARIQTEDPEIIYRSVEDKEIEARNFLRSIFGERNVVFDYYTQFGEILQAKANMEICAICSGAVKICPMNFRPKVVYFENKDGKEEFIVRISRCNSASISNSPVGGKFEQLFSTSGLSESQRNLTFDLFDNRGGELEISKSTALQAVKDNSWLCFAGKCGTGKTHLSVAVLLEKMRSGQTGVFRLCSELLNELRSGHADGSFDEKMQFFKEVACLVMDDIGKEKPTDAALDYLFQIVDFRYREKKQTIATTNFMTPNELSNAKGAQVFEPLVSRFFEMGHWISLKNISDHRLSKKTTFRKVA